MKKLLSFLLLILSLSFTSCEKEELIDNYFSLTWSMVEPDYVETDALPSTFYWNDYYYVSPGTYYLYYDGYFWDGWYWQYYDWEVEFTVYADYSDYNRDEYITIDCNPYGPYTDRSMLKSTDKDIEITKRNGKYRIDIIYHRVDNNDKKR